MDEVHYIQVVLPLRLAWVPCYRSSEPLPRGSRVSVVFARREYQGVVWRTDADPGIESSRIQKILKVNTELPPVSEEELRFWEFLSSYYLCSPGEVFKAAYPSGKIKSELVAAGILERLRSRLAVREEALTRKHKDAVRERLEAERDSLSAQIAALTKVAADAPARKAPPRPLLLIGPGRMQEYVQKTRKAVADGFNVLVLTPEIAASEQLESLFDQEFPGIVHRLNSHLSDARRRRIAEDVRNFGGQIVVGTRSALFLPFSRLGLVIVENEQDILFKQTEPSPRYNGRDAAVVLARIHGAAVVLGTPAPSLESLHNALCGKYEMKVAGVCTTPVNLVDISAERRKNGMPGRMSRKLLEAASRATGPIALIRGWEKPDELSEEIANMLPGREVDVFTLQEARLKDLSPYAVVAVLQADALMSANDFRADERALQALAMLREACHGTFIVQTARKDHPVFGNPKEVYTKLLEERRQFSLPPWTRLVDIHEGTNSERITLTPDATLAARKQEILESAVKKENGGRVRVTIDVDPA